MTLFYMILALIILFAILNFIGYIRESNYQPKEYLELLREKYERGSNFIKEYDKDFKEIDVWKGFTTKWEDQILEINPSIDIEKEWVLFEEEINSASENYDDFCKKLISDFNEKQLTLDKKDFNFYWLFKEMKKKMSDKKWSFVTKNYPTKIGKIIWELCARYGVEDPTLNLLNEALEEYFDPKEDIIPIPSLDNISLYVLSQYLDPSSVQIKSIGDFYNINNIFPVSRLKTIRKKIPFYPYVVYNALYNALYGDSSVNLDKLGWREQTLVLLIMINSKNATGMYVGFRPALARVDYDKNTQVPTIVEIKEIPKKDQK